MAKDPNVKNKKEAFSSNRLEMIPYYEKKLGDAYRIVGEKYLAENGNWLVKCAMNLPKVND